MNVTRQDDSTTALAEKQLQVEQQITAEQQEQANIAQTVAHSEDGVGIAEQQLQVEQQITKEKQTQVALDHSVAATKPAEHVIGGDAQTTQNEANKMKELSYSVNDV